MYLQNWRPFPPGTPDLVLVAEDASGLTAAVFGTFDGRRGWVNRLATRTDRLSQGYASAVLAEP
jgi:hypothetical protein